mmetsp:Transcript_49235/g.98749  ORF Transcript_49235/g.98749 Transcript_49235/m.98749 type:complete len:394 (+) Transcript_49235:1-1182(+)
MIVSAALMMAMCVAVILSGTSSPPRTALVGIAQDMPLADSLIHAAAELPVEHLSAVLQSWQDQQVSDFDSQDSQEMLAAIPSNIETVLEDSGKLCAKKDIIFQKFNELLTKLGHEQEVRNTTDKKLHDAKQAALKAWLDGESAYRLQKEKVKEARQGARYAREMYEKWSATVKGTQERVDKMKAQYGKELADIKLERDLIHEILRLLGIMEAQPLDDASKKAGGYAAKEGASPLTLAEVKGKLSMLKREAANTHSPIDVSQVDSLESKLASFAESDEVKKLLGAMLKALEQRETVINKALAQTKTQLKEHTEKLVSFEKQVVDLSNAADKAKQAADSADLQRQKLDGTAVNAKEAYKTEHAEFVIVSPPAERAIYIIKTIMKKVEAFCSAKTK